MEFAKEEQKLMIQRILALEAGVFVLRQRRWGPMRRGLSELIVKPRMTRGLPVQEEQITSMMIESVEEKNGGGGDGGGGNHSEWK